MLPMADCDRIHWRWVRLPSAGTCSISYVFLAHQVCLLLYAEQLWPVLTVVMWHCSSFSFIPASVCAKMTVWTRRGWGESRPPHPRGILVSPQSLLIPTLAPCSFRDFERETDYKQLIFPLFVRILQYGPLRWTTREFISPNYFFENHCTKENV